FVSLLIILSGVLLSQNIERKIVIQNGNYFFTTIDDENQLATLWTGKDSSAIKTAKKLAIPAGRNYNDPINPFSWDVSGKNLYAVSFFMHPLNDRNEAIKRIDIASLKEWSEAVTQITMINQSIDMSPFAYNDPYQCVIKRSNTLNNFFFDAIALSDSSFYMAIANNGELSIWNYNGKEWRQGDVQNFPLKGYFSLFAHKNKVYLATNAGGLYEVSGKEIADTKNKSVGTTLSSCILVVNKDDDSVWYLKNNDIDQRTPLNLLITKKAKRIF
ncbi:MAG: hypothetical protein H0X46_07135, partial [Bacteroidetes bacterium]|nr:hypothetical protein [Bacteroidota bacterium]